MCNKSESIVNLAKALVAFNAEMKMIAKDAQNPHFKNDYATLDNIIDECRPLLAKHGLVMMQFPGGDGEKFTLRSMLIHESGEWIESESLTMRPVKNDPQGIGSCTTYARRYSYSSMLSLNTGEDDDGNGASHGSAQPQGATQPQGAGQQRPTKEQAIKTIQSGPLLSESQANYASKLKKDKRLSDDEFRKMVAQFSEGNVDLYAMSKAQAANLINHLASVQMAGA